MADRWLGITRYAARTLHGSAMLSPSIQTQRCGVRGMTSRPNPNPNPNPDPNPGTGVPVYGVDERWTRRPCSPYESTLSRSPLSLPGARSVRAGESLERQDIGAARGSGAPDPLLSGQPALRQCAGAADGSMKIESSSPCRVIGRIGLFFIPLSPHFFCRRVVRAVFGAVGLFLFNKK